MDIRNKFAKKLGISVKCGEGGGLFEIGADVRVDNGLRCGFCAYGLGCEEGKYYSVDYMAKLEALTPAFTDDAAEEPEEVEDDTDFREKESDVEL